jgi:hypothetical protein
MYSDRRVTVENANGTGWTSWDACGFLAGFAFPWTSARADAGLQAELGHRPADPCRPAERAAVRDADLQSFQFRRRLGSIHLHQPVSRTLDRPVAEPARKLTRGETPVNIKPVLFPQTCPVSFRAFLCARSLELNH